MGVYDEVKAAMALPCSEPGCGAQKDEECNLTMLKDNDPESSIIEFHLIRWKARHASDA